MILRCLLVFAVLVLCVRFIYFLYIFLLRNEIQTLVVDTKPSNRKVSYIARNISVGTAKSKSASSISTQRRNSAHNILNGESYASYRARNKVIK